MKTTIKNTGKLLLIIFLFYGTGVNAQNNLPECETQVPIFILDLSNNPDSAFTTPEVVRQGNCCGTATSDNYLSFYVTLHPDVAMFEIIIAPGYADPSGAGVYNIISGGDLLIPGACGVDIPGGQPVCIVGSGPHKITYRKPGKNKVKYIFRQIPKPIFPQDDSTRVGCSSPLQIYGLNNINMTSINSSTGNTTPGAYNSLLSCTNCPTPSFSPELSTPAWIDYQICGTPQAQACGTYTPCDTVRLYTFSELSLTASPNPASYCLGGSGVTLTATASGGNGIYSYKWRNSSGTIVSSLNTYLALTAGTYTVEATDGLASSTCPPRFVSIPVSIGNPPIVNAGIDQILCATSPIAFLTGSVQYADSGVWSGGSGTFNPSASALLTTYTPTSSEISSGSVTLTLTSAGAGGGCVNDNDTVVINFSDTVFVNPTALPISCNGNQTTISANASGGTAPYTYYWSNGSSSPSISASAGTYSVMVSDFYGCAAASPISITNPTQLSLIMSSTNVSADLACDGNATVSIFGGTSPYAVLWSNLETTTTTSSTLCYGIYTVEVTDANGCTIEGSVVVNKPFCSLFDVTATSTDVDCYGGSNGTAASFPAGGILPYTYSWNSTPNQTTQNASNLIAGNYTVIVTDSVGCIDVAGVTIQQPTIITNSITHIDVSSIGGSDGSATANPQGGVPPYQYAWTPSGQNTQTATNLFSAVGGLVHYLTITDDKSCTLNDSVLINQPPCNNFVLGVNTTNVSCNGLSDGSAYIVIAHGTPPYNIVWSNGPTNVTSISGLSQGIYTVTVTDASNCTTFQSFTITEPDVISLGLIPTNITCYGSKDGTIDLSVSGGIFPYTYEWTTGGNVIANYEDLAGLSPGIYSVTIFDENKCMAVSSIGITQPGMFVANYSYVDNLCNGVSTGSINLTTTGGTLPYNYSWTGPLGYTSTNEDINGLTFGLYNVNITDGTGCKTPSYQVYINQPDVVIIESIVVSCPIIGASTVNVTVDSISGGMGGPYQISFNNQVTFLPLGVYTTSLSVDSTYQVWAKDANGCLSVAAYVLTIDTNVNVTSVTFNPCIAQGASTIPVTITPTGGDGWPYQVSSNGGVSWDATGTYVINLPVNASYNISIKDGKGCISTNYPIIIPAEISSNIVMTTQVSCIGAGDGALILTVNGGTPSYLFAWTGSSGFTSSNEDLINLYVGNYHVTITDNNGCTKLDSIVITTVVDTTDPVITCMLNQIVGAASCVYVVSGTAWDATATDNCIVIDVSYTLSGATFGSGNSLNGVSFNLGVTTVTWVATDSLGNTDQCTYNITVIDNIDPSFIACGSGNQTVNVDAGDCNYTQTTSDWDATATDNCTVSSITADLSGATTGSGLTTLTGINFNTGITHVLWTVTDTVGNSTDCSYDITVIDNIDPSIIMCGAGDQTVNVDADECNYTQTTIEWDVLATDNCTVSSITATLTGATTDSGLTTLAGVNFNTGITHVLWTVTDTVGNTTTCSYDITVIDNIDPSIIACGVGNRVVSSDTGVCTYINVGLDWDATATDNCTVALITYSLSGVTTGTGLSLNGVVFNPGLTTVVWTVIDTSGNSSTCTFTVEVIDTELPVISNCPTNIVVSNDNGSCGAILNWTPPTFTDNCGATIASTHYSGDYFNVGTTTITYTVTDLSGNVSNCSFDVTVNDTEAPIVVCPAPIASCDSLINFNNPIVSDNCGILSTTQIAGLPSGSIFPVGVTTITFEAIDIHNNSTQCSFDVTVHPTPILALQATNVNCNDFSDGSIDLTVTNGTSPYTYLWSNSAITEDISNLSPGNYSVVITDVNSCSAIAQTSITQPNVLTIAANNTQVSCFNGNNGAIEVTVGGGVYPYTYLWSNNEITEDISNLTLGFYQVNATDFNGCLISYSTTITQPDSLMIETVIYDATCNAENGSIQTQVTGGTTPYVYFWTNGTSNVNLNNVVAGTYTLNVTDAFSCTNQFTGTIGSVSNLIAEVLLRDVSCFGKNNGEIGVIISSGNAPYNYNWSNNETTPSITQLTAGNYSVNVTDVFGCQIGMEFTISQPDSLFVLLSVSNYPSGTNVSLYGGNDGFITSEVFGGVLPYSYLWSNKSIDSDIYDLISGQYSVIVTDANECLAYAATELTQPLILEMPSGFSPNIDGSNDYFVVKGIEAYPKNEITIFNRWGNIVYQKSNYNNEWEGKNLNGDELPDATYFVIFTTQDTENITLTGYVDLRR